MRQLLLLLLLEHQEHHSLPPHRQVSVRARIEVRKLADAHVLLQQVHQLRHLKEEKYANEERKLQVKEGPLVDLVAQRFSAVFRVVFASQAAEKERAEEVEAASLALVAENFWAETVALDR